MRQWKENGANPTICKFARSVVRTFRDTSPYKRYRSGFLSGLWTPLLETFRNDSTKGVSSSTLVSGMVKMGCASRSSGWMISMRWAEWVHWPPTRFGTAYTLSVVPSALGSIVAQSERDVMLR
jgi:hypothetical protein